MNDRPSPRVALLLIGNEILSGKIQDQNGFVATRLLRQSGASLEEICVIPDEREIMVRKIRQLSHDFNCLVTSGGVGPTHDDITMDCVAEALNDEMVLFPKMLAGLRKGYGERYNPSVDKMAYMPSKARLLQSKVLEWPLIVVENIYVLPGIPPLFQTKLTQVCEILGGDPFFLEEVYLSVDESEVAGRLFELDREYEKVVIGSYPAWGGVAYKTRVTFESQDPDLVHRAREDFLSDISSEMLVNEGKKK